MNVCMYVCMYVPRGSRPHIKKTNVYNYILIIQYVLLLYATSHIILGKTQKLVYNYVPLPHILCATHTCSQICICCYCVIPGIRSLNGCVVCFLSRERKQGIPVESGRVNQFDAKTRVSHLYMAVTAMVLA